MFDAFTHYLSYGAADQQTARQLKGFYDGLLVPGTVASFQAEGTKGFVLTLSASARPAQYVIDPRFPLFQQQLLAPKKSHEALAEKLNAPELVNRDREPTPGDFSDELIDRVSKAWLEFNGGYTTVSSKHFEKYAERLGETVLPIDSRAPTYVLPPYTVVRTSDLVWRDVSDRLWESSERQSVGTSLQGWLVQVLAVDGPSVLDRLLIEGGQERAVIWCSDLNELDLGPLSSRDLYAYGMTIRNAGRRGQSMFALYGGFFSVLLGSIGLSGSSHGIGYGESRSWVELPSSGPPPARYYLPRAHRYVSEDLALVLWREARELAACACLECDGGSPAHLDYHGLMRHSVRCRHAEIEQWSGRDLGDSAEVLKIDADVFRTELSRIDVPRPLRRQAEQCFAHLDGWSDVLTMLTR